MLFYVIYSVDIPRSQRIKRYRPPFKMARTEGDESYDYNHLGGRWLYGKHRKWADIITKQELDALVREQYLYAQKIVTQGSFTEYGHLPAVSFTIDDADAKIAAYVTPLPQQRDGRWFIVYEDDRRWQYLRCVLVRMYRP